MEKRLFIMKQALCLIVLFALTACGDKNSGDDYSDTYYELLYNGDTTNPYLDWSTKSTFLRLEFGEDIPKGSEWHIYCSEPWVKIGKTNGKVNSLNEEISISVADNNNSKDREAYIYLDVDHGTSSSSTVIIHQYGLDSHLEMGRTVSFRTDRFWAESQSLTIDQIKVYQVMDVDWGDGSKTVLTKNDYYSTSNLSITHRYPTEGLYNVSLRFAPENGKISFSFILGRNQGIESVNYYDGGSVTKGIDSSKKVAVIYSDDSGFKVNQY